MSKDFRYDEIIKKLNENDKSWHELFRVLSMSAGIYRLRIEDSDLQTPHTEDKLYYIVQGKAELMVGKENVFVEKGSIVFVEANVEHWFHNITEHIVALVIFSPSKYTNEM